MDKIRLTVKGISGSLDKPDFNVLILGSQEQEYGFPVILGLYEAQSIAFRIEECTPKIPFSHDLFFNLAREYNVEIIEVLIKDYVSSTYFVDVLCFDGKKYMTFNARISDAVALALRFTAPIFITKDALLKISVPACHDMQELEVILNDAVKNEDYETAIAVRNEIRRRQETV